MPDRSVPPQGSIEKDHVFRPRARIIRTLGRDLISSEYIAIQEIVKNSYDADASSVRLRFVGPFEVGKGELVIEDDGHGMSAEILTSAWMEPATVSKLKDRRSANGRVLTGEKGIGRFAAARVASRLELSSISAVTGKMISASFNWGDFEDESKYLDEVSCTWTESDAVGLPSGTTLRLIGFHDDWSRMEGERRGVAFERLRRELARLISPLMSKSFRIDIDAPDPFDAFSGPVEPPPLLAQPHYWMTGNVNGDGEIDAIFQRLGDDPEAVMDGEQKPRIVLSGGRSLTSGAFQFEFRAWDRGREDLLPLASRLGSSLKDLQRDLNAASGIGIYRDGFRVMLPDNADWLRLDARRVQNPTLRLSNNQLVGLVSISREANRGLVDQTNREGVVESTAFADFRAAVLEVLSLLEVKRDLRRRPAVSVQLRSVGLLSKLDLSPLRTYIVAKYSSDASLTGLLREAEGQLSEGVGEVKRVLARYRRLATLGQLIDGLLHDGRTPVATISGAVELGRKDLLLFRLDSESVSELKQRIEKRFAQIDAQTGVLAQLFKRIAPFSGRRRGKPEPVPIESILRQSLDLAGSQITRMGVAVTIGGDSATVTVDPADMQSIFFNLIENALHWLERVPKEQRKLSLHVTVLPGELQVEVSDNGEGVPEDLREKIFEPYFTTKGEGVGLGLAIAGEVVAEYDGALELVSDGALDGATFRVSLRKGVGVKK